MMKAKGFIPLLHAYQIQEFTEGKFSVARMPVKQRRREAVTP